MNTVKTANSYLQLSYKNASNNTEINTRHISDILSQHLIDTFQDAFSTTNNENNKLRTYGLVKSSVGLENYLR